MQHEVIEKVFVLGRTDGRYMHINHVKCGRGTKYELIMKDDDGRVSSMLLSKDEVARLCHSGIRNPGMNVAIDLVDSDYNPRTILEEVDLSTVVNEYADCFSDRSRISSLIADFTPEMTLERNLLMNVYDSGLLEDFRKETYFGSNEIASCINVLSTTYGIKTGYALWAIDTWARAFGKNCYADSFWEKCIHKNIDRRRTHRDNKTEEGFQTNKKVDYKEEYEKGDIIIQTSAYYIQYLGIELKPLFGEIHFRFLVDAKNLKPANHMRIESVKVNGIDLKIERGIISIKDETRIINSELYAKGMNDLSIKTVKDIESIKIKIHGPYTSYYDKNEFEGYLSPDEADE